MDLSNDEKPRLICGAGWDFQQVGIVSQSLGIDEVDAVLRLVGLALERVELKVHRVQNLYLFGAEDVRRFCCFQFRWPAAGAALLSAPIGADLQSAPIGATPETPQSIRDGGAG